MQPQWKMIYLARRNPALAPAAFPQAWREHSALGRQCRNVQDKVLGVAQCSRLLDLDLPGVSADYDGVGLLQLRDGDAVNGIWSDVDTLAIMRPDELRVFSTYVRGFTLVCHEYPLRDGLRSDCVLYGFLCRRAGLSKVEFDAGWLDGSARWLAMRCRKRGAWCTTRWCRCRRRATRSTALPSGGSIRLQRCTPRWLRMACLPACCRPVRSLSTCGTRSSWPRV